MAISAKKTEEKKEDVTYNVEVTRAKDFTKEGGQRTISFDMKVNGITIYGMWYREYVKKEGGVGSMISFPSQKGNDGNYYNHAWFPISKDLQTDIEEKVAAVL